MRRMAVILAWCAACLTARGQDWNLLGAMWTQPSASAAAWTPANEVFWVDGSDASSMSITNISGAQRIDSISNKGTIPLTIPKGTYRPTLVLTNLNGKSVISSATDMGFSATTNVAIGQNVSGLVMVALARYNGSSMGAPDNILLRLIRSGYTRARLAMAYATTSVDGGGRRLMTDSYQNYTASITNVGSWHIYAAYFDYAASNLVVSIDGNRFARPGGFQTPGSTENDPSTVIDLALVYGWFAEGVMSHSGANLEKIEGYMAWKWGLQTNLPPTHPYYGAAP